MKHTLRLTLGLLAIGAATSVLIAWGIALWKPQYAATSSSDGKYLVGAAGDGKAWLLSYNSGSVDAHLLSDWAFGARVLPPANPESPDAPWSISGFLQSVDVPPSKLGIPSPVEEIADTFVRMYGWPAPSNARRMKARLGSFVEGDITAGFTVSMHEASVDPYSDFVPMTLVWRGLFLNTVFYAALWAVPLALLSHLIRRRRIRLGLCTKCKYELAELATCPECGTKRPTPSAGSSPSSCPSPAHR